MTQAKKENKLRWWEVTLLLSCLLLFATQAGLSSTRKSAAFDEEYHVAAGYAYLKTGDFRMSLSHPPLINALSALPLLWRDDVNLPTDHPAWHASDYFNFSDVFLWQAQTDPQSILEWSRWPIILLGTLLAAALFWWARHMINPLAGWVALLLATFDPNLLTNSRLTTTDLGLTCLLFLTMWRLWCWQQRPFLPQLLLVGLCVGLTMSAKFTGVMVWPMLVTIMLLWGWQEGKRPFSHLRPLLIIGITAYLTLWAIFRFDASPYPGTNIPLPASFYPYSLLDTFIGIEEQPKTSFLLGHTSPRGWWYYFPVALLLKTPLPLLLLAAVGTIPLFKRLGWRQSSLLWLPPTLFMLLAMTGRITIGYRHILPLVPFLIMMAAYVATLPAKSINNIPLKPTLITLLLLWHAGGTLRLFPHQEAFFNELAGSPANGGNLLVDSNIDWGQDLISLREVMGANGIEEVYLGYFGTAVPEAYNIPYQPIPGFLRHTAGPEINSYNPYTPPPGWYAISLTSLQLGLLEQNLDMYAYFRDKTPTHRAGYSINLYHVTDAPSTPIDRHVVTGASVSDIPAEELGIENGRRLLTKWRADDSTTIIPFTDSFTPPDNFQPVVAPFSDIFTLLGYTTPTPTPKQGDPIQLTLIWQRGATNVPTPAPTKASPLAAFVHLSGAEPSQIYTQFDGWPTAVATLEAGDIIMQQITLWPPPDMPQGEAFLRVGLYSPQTGQRFPLADGSADFVTIGTLDVTQ